MPDILQIVGVSVGLCGHIGISTIHEIPDIAVGIEKKETVEMRLLVIGGNGHYGGLITDHLAKKHEISIFDLQKRARTFDCVQTVGDIMDLDQISKAVDGIDAVVTFFVGDAALSTMGMVNLLTAAEQHGVGHVVYTSSGGMTFPIDTFQGDYPLFPMGDFPAVFWRDYFPITEDAGMFPGQETAGYFLHKWLCEEIGKRFVAREKVKFTAIRPGLLMHDDMTNRPGGETTRNHDPFFMLTTGQVRMCDAARMYDLALSNPPLGFEAYHCSNDTPYNNLSVEKAKRQLGYACMDQKPYMDFYAGLNWSAAFETLVGKGFSGDLLRGMYGFRNC
ncbi:MAG: SDR family oxidoreductase [Candidatus Latescibacteria bacterium]|nr:SDR family oxidoreductase [Candidatus Latescibacterota bacterium]